MLRFSVSAVVFSASMHAFAIECIPTPSKQCVDTITVTATTLGDVDFGGGSGFGSGVGVAAFGSSVGVAAASPTTEAIIAIIKTVCMKSGETCAAWGQRMTGQLNPTDPPPLCTTLFSSAGYTAISICRTEATLESAVNSCANIPSCP